MPIATARRLVPRACWVLTLAVAAGCHSVTGLGERTLTLEVAASRVACTGLFPTTCLQTRERADAPWQAFYDSIAGFSYEPGYNYVLRVAQRPVSNPPADGSSMAYRLIAVLAKVAVPAAEP